MGAGYGSNIITSGAALYLDGINRRSYPRSGTSWYDLSKNKYHGNLQNSPSYDSLYKGLVFNGSNSYVSGGDTSIVNGNYTIDVWYEATGSPSLNDSAGGFLFAQSNNFYHGINLLHSWANQSVSHGSRINDGIQTSNNTAPNNTVINATATYDGSTQKIYINGALSTSRSYTLNPYAVSPLYQVGRWGYGGYERYFNGVIYSVKLYDRALTSAEILQNYKTTKGRFGINKGLIGQKYSGYFADNVNYFATATKVGDRSLFTTIDNGTPPWNVGDYYSYEWIGYFLPSTTETYTFYTYSDDAGYLWIGNNAVSGFTTANALINNGGVHPPREYSNTIALTAGVLYPIRIQFGENDGADRIKISFSTPTITKTSNGTGYYFS